MGRGRPSNRDLVPLVRPLAATGRNRATAVRRTAERAYGVDVKAREIAPGVYLVLSGFVQAYLVESNDSLVLVDCGVPKSAGRIAESVRALGRQVARIEHILVTHHHDDHIGGLAELADRSEAAVYVHADDAAVVRGDEPLAHPTPSNPVMRLVRRTMAGPSALSPVQGITELTGGETLPLAGGIRVLHTPGHTRGHVSFLVEREPRTLIVGDAAMNFLGLQPSAGTLAELFTVDHQAARRSFGELAALDFEVAVFGHGRPITAGASERFRRVARRHATPT